METYDDPQDVRAFRDIGKDAPELVEPFDRNLARHGLSLVRGKTDTLQVNVGFLCDLSCRHCHLEAGPERREVMSVETMNDVIDYASRNRFETIDITGGAPELLPGAGLTCCPSLPLSDAASDFPSGVCVFGLSLFPG